MVSLSRQQLQRLAKEGAALADWTVVRDWAAQMYGEGKAARVEIDTYEHYDDENYSYELGDVVAYGADGNELKYDHSLPFFATKAWKGCSDGFGEKGEDFDIFKEMSEDDMKKQRNDWILAEDLPHPDDVGCTITFDLTKQPCLSQVTLKDEEHHDDTE